VGECVLYGRNDALSRNTQGIVNGYVTLVGARFIVASADYDFYQSRSVRSLKASKPVILSAAKDLGAQQVRSFAALRMTLWPILIVKLHDRPVRNPPHAWMNMLKLIIASLQNYAILCLKVSNFLYILRLQLTIFRKLTKITQMVTLQDSSPPATNRRELQAVRSPEELPQKYEK
jgi:hypothetical protein